VRFLIALTLSCASTAFGFVSDSKISELPAEARATLARIKAGGPFPYPQDGKTFQNREKLLPQRNRGYYREYTVKTPGAKDRGARRIVAGGCGESGCIEYFYTADHYRSFRRIIE
jgi:ribonuclease T1